MRVRQTQIADLEELMPLFDSYRQFYGEQPDLVRAKDFLPDRFEQQQPIIIMEFMGEEAVGLT